LKKNSCPLSKKKTSPQGWGKAPRLEKTTQNEPLRQEKSKRIPKEPVLAQERGRSVDRRRKQGIHESTRNSVGQVFEKKGREEIRSPGGEGRAAFLPAKGPEQNGEEGKKTASKVARVRKRGLEEGISEL